MNLFPDEKILLESDNKELTLTTHRVRHVYRRGGEVYLTSLTLEALQSCELRQASYPLWLYLGGCFVLLGVILLDKSLAYLIIGLIFAGISLFAYLATRRQVLRLASSGGAIVAELRGLSAQAATDFIDAVEAAKLALVRGLLSQ